jgi:hypothetical protein
MSTPTEKPTPAGTDWTWGPTTLEDNDDIVNDDDIVDDDGDEFTGLEDDDDGDAFVEENFITDEPTPTPRPTAGPTVPPTLPPTEEPTLPPTQPPTNPPTIQPTTKAQAKAVVKGTVLSSGHDIGFQSNWGSKSTFSGSMQYDFTRHSIYLTGVTYEDNRFDDTIKTDLPRSSCFVGHIPIANLAQWKTVDEPLPPSAIKGKGVDTDFIIPDSLNDKEQMGCNTILYDSSGSSNSFGDYLYVGGVDEKDMSSRGDSSITGFINVYERSRASPNWTNKQIQSTELQNPTTPDDPTTPDVKQPKIPVRYPIAMAYGIDGSVGPEIAVISISSDDPLLTDAFIENGDKNNPNMYKNSLLSPGIGSKSNPSKKDYYKRGSNFYISFQHFKLEGDGIVFNSGIDLKSTLPKTSTIMPTGMINLNPNGKSYEIAGYIKGSAPREWKGFLPTSTDNDYDGFVAGIRYPSTRPTWQGITIRFSSTETNPQLDDYIHDICDDPSDEKSFYVVGSSKGTMPTGTLQPDNSDTLPYTTFPYINDDILSGWVSKIDSTTRTVLWTTQIYGSYNTEAFGCHVIPDDPSLMYIGGTVFSSGEIMYVSHGPNAAVSQSSSSGNSAGQDDVWVAQLDTSIGSLKWVKQFGSSGNDRISRTNGVQADIEGDCIIYGDTNGELYRTKSIDETNAGYSDIFIVKLDKIDGSYTSTIENDRLQINKKHATIGAAGGAFIILSLCICGCIFYKFRRPRRRRNNKNLDANGGLASDGIFTDAMYRDDAEDNFDTTNDIEFTDQQSPSTTNGGNNNNASNNNNNNDVIADAITQSYNDNIKSYSDNVVPPSHPNGTLESNMITPDQSAFKDDPNYRPGRNFV